MERERGLRRGVGSSEKDGGDLGLETGKNEHRRRDGG